MPDSLNLNENTYLELLKEGMPGRQHKPTPPVEEKNVADLLTSPGDTDIEDIDEAEKENKI